MLEGLEATEVSLSAVLKDNTTNRIDSEYFKKEYLSFFENIDGLRPLGDFVEEGYRVVYENTEVLEPESEQHNYPFFLQATDISTPFINTDKLHYVCESDWNRYPKGRIKKGELLIEVKGKVEKVAIVPDDFPINTLVSGSIYKMTINEKISKHTLLTYLISKYGISFKHRFQTNLLIPYISKPDLYRIPIPFFSDTIQHNVDELFASLFRCQKESITKYRLAESLLLEQLGLTDFAASPEKYNVKSLKDSFLETGRIDAEYYLPKYEDYSRIIKAYPNGSSIIRQHFVPVTDVFPIRESGTCTYIEIGDIDVSNGAITYQIYSNDRLPANAIIAVSKDDLLISTVRPNRGAVAIVDSITDRIVASGAFTVLREKTGSIKKEVLFTLLRTPLYRDWLLQSNTGCSYPVIKDDDILDFPIPLIRPEIQNEIAQHVQKSFALRKEAMQLLEQAKMTVEQAIDNGGGV